jgi:tRNA(Arg) A34 adenosine deaminase TadA
LVISRASVGSLGTRNDLSIPRRSRDQQSGLFEENVGRRVAELSEQASRQGTFGIGGIVLTKSGEVLAEALNAVIQNGQFVDPTAHVERQLVDWLFSDGQYHVSSPLEQIVIVSSLDPCAMCAGAILRAGVNVVSIAADEMSGVHGASSEPLRIPRGLRGRAERQLAVFGVEGSRPRTGMDFGELFSTPISQRVCRRAHNAFSASVDHIRRIIGGSGEPPTGTMTVGYRPYVKILREYIHHLPGFVRTMEDIIGRNIYDDWRRGLSCVLEDYTGQVILGVSVESSTAPTESDLVRLIRAYCALRNKVPETLRTALPHPRFFSAVTKKFPDDDDKALFELGTIGSFMEEERPPQGRAALLYLDATDDRRAKEILQSLPPLYTQVIGLTIAPVRG